MQPAFVGPQIGDITGPFLFGCRGRKVLPETIRRHRQVVIGVGRGLELLRRLGPQSLAAQACCDGLAVIRMTLVDQIPRQSRRAVAAFAGGEAPATR